MSEEKFCYIHKDKPTRISCSSCGNPVCPKCMINAAVGYRCKECCKSSNHLTTVTNNQYIYAIASGLLIGILAGFIWNYLREYGFIINGVVAYAVGFCIARTITKVIGYKVNPNLRFLAAVITIISMVYNPILMAISLTSIPFVTLIASITLFNLSNLLNIIAIAIAIWSATRHLEF